MRRSLLVIAVLSLMLAACGELPRPFQHAAGRAPTPLIELRMDVRLYPLVDVPADAAAWLDRALVDAFGAEGLAAARSDDVDARFALDGVYQPIDAKTGVVRWTLRHGDGSEVETHSFEVDIGPGDWRPESADRIRAVAAEAVAAFAPTIGPTSANSGTPDRMGVMVDGVEGAPGDGNDALARALAMSLEAAGVPVAGSVKESEYVLHGIVAVGPAKDGEQAVSLIWRVSRTDGAFVGQARQDNAVPAASLDHRWGMVARFAAQAAVPGIVDILQRDAAAPFDGGAIEIPTKTELPSPGTAE